MRLERLACAFLASIIATVVAPQAHAAVIVVDPLGFGDFTTIQPAVNAAVDGDIIVLRAGGYGGFDIVDKSLTITSDGATNVATYTIGSRTSVKNLSAGKTVVFNRVNMKGLTSNAMLDDGGSALYLDHCTGAVRVEASTLRGSKANPSHVTGYPSILAIDAHNVEVMGCSSFGGNGYGVSCATSYSITGYPGGQALRLSGSQVIVHDSTLIGGSGGSVCVNGGAGGISIANIFVMGGTGGSTDDFIAPGIGGTGGAACFIAAGQTVSTIDSTVQGGGGGGSFLPGGGGFGGPVQSGPGTLTALGFPGRSLTVTPVAIDNATTTITVKAPIGDLALLFLSASAGPLLAGPETVPLALGTLVGPYSLGAIPGSGSIVIPAANPQLPPGVEGVGLHLQVVTSGPSGFALTGPAHLVLLSSLL